MKVEYERAAVKALKEQDESTRSRILEKISGLTLNPPIGDIKKLKGYGNSYRLRIGKFRVIYEYCIVTVDKNKETILRINDIDSRGDIYK